MCLSTFGEKKRCWLEVGPCHLGLLNICPILWTFRNNYVVDFVKEAVIGKKNVSITSGSKTSWQAGRSGEHLSRQTWWPSLFLKQRGCHEPHVALLLKDRGVCIVLKCCHACGSSAYSVVIDCLLLEIAKTPGTITVVSSHVFEYHFYAATQLCSLFLFSYSEKMLWSHLLSRPVE